LSCSTEPETTDCAGIEGGSATIDDCGLCTGGTTGNTANYLKDCSGECGGDAELDCLGECNGLAVTDECGTCDIDVLNDCTQDCLGTWGGVSVLSGCDNLCNSTKVNDDCGICGGDNSICTDCADVPNGDALVDNCGMCDTDVTNDCVPDCSGEWGGELIDDACGICGGDGICDFDEGHTYGCTNPSACNFDANATIFDDSCWFATDGCECDDGEGSATDNCSTCDADSSNDCIQDCAGTWGGDFVEDCTGICGGLYADCSVFDIDGNGYTTTIIGVQEWFVQNLKVTHYNSGDEIEFSLYGDDDWGWAYSSGNYFLEAQYSVYDNVLSNVNIYGYLYNWAVVSSDVCPTGWHVPSLGEWTTLQDYLGGESVAGGKMKSTGTVENSDGLWVTPNTGATNESGFTALPGGSRGQGYVAPSPTGHPGGTFGGIGGGSYFWTSTQKYSSQVDHLCFWSGTCNAYAVQLYNSTDNVYVNDYEKTLGASIRCIKD